MGGSCSKEGGCCAAIMDPELEQMDHFGRSDALDPVMYDLMRKSLNLTLQQQQRQGSSVNNGSDMVEAAPPGYVGQFHLLFKHQKQDMVEGPSTAGTNTARKSKHNKRSHHHQSSGKQQAGSASQAESQRNSYSPQQPPHPVVINTVPLPANYPTRLVVRRRPHYNNASSSGSSSGLVSEEGGTHGTHIYSVRYPVEDWVQTNATVNSPSYSLPFLQEQCPDRRHNHQQHRYVGSPDFQLEKKKKRGSSAVNSTAATTASSQTSSSTSKLSSRSIRDPPGMIATNSTSNSTSGTLQRSDIGHDLFQPSRYKVKQPKMTITDWVTVSEEHNIFVVDVGLTPAQCDSIVQVTEHVCRGQYAAYTYAKQTLGCREFPTLAQACAPPVHAVIHAIMAMQQTSSNVSQNLQLDDREPHLVKYDVTKKERQKLDMHTDKSEWTFLIALSNGCGLDYDGGGTYFECLNATIHVQRGHALIFPGKLRHCGQRITRGLRYLLVGFLVDKTSSSGTSSSGGISNTIGSSSGNNNIVSTSNSNDHSPLVTTSPNGTRIASL